MDSFHVIAVTDVLSWIIKFTVTCFTTQSLYYPQVIYITTIKLVAAVSFHFVSFFSPSLVVSSWYLQVEKKKGLK
jgi:hypothetical protein